MASLSIYQVEVTLLSTLAWVLSCRPDMQEKRKVMGRFRGVPSFFHLPSRLESKPSRESCSSS